MAKGEHWYSGIKPRDIIAFGILGLSVLMIAVLAGLAIGFASAGTRPGMTRLVFASVLPLFGTWVGTILAFYFARDNFQAATESTIRLTGRLEPRTPVQQVMIPKARITSHDLKSGEDPRKISLHGLYAQMQSTNNHRIPILSETGAVLYVVHDSTIASFAQPEDPSKPDYATTMAGLLDKAEFKKAVEACGFVGPNAVLADARAAMRSVDGCNDVFVTTSGQKGDPILGWLTNTDLAGLE